MTDFIVYTLSALAVLGGSLLVFHNFRRSTPKVDGCISALPLGPLEMVSTDDLINELQRRSPSSLILLCDDKQRQLRANGNCWSILGMAREAEQVVLLKIKELPVVTK